MDAILKSLPLRKRRWGIRAASDYVSSFAGCLGDGFCPTSLLAVPAETWAQCLKDSESRLTYANPAMVTKGVAESDIPDGGIMAFDCIITTTRKDRDGDVLESAGALLDAKMPLLWQHLPLQPIGKFVSETSRAKRYVGGRFAIADLPLGRDAATLVKFGALRISHGFEPVEYEPLDDDKGEQIGWRILKFHVMETSLVSVPSNVDAEILSSVSKSKSFAQELDGIRTAYGRNLLQTELVKQWAKRIYDNRPTQSVGAECACAKKERTVATAAAATMTVKIDAGDLVKALEAVEDKLTTKAQPPSSLKMYGEYHLSGSYEAIQCQLRETLKRHLMASKLAISEYSYCYLEATFPGYAIVCVESRNGYDHYRVAYALDGDVPKWDGEPEQVEIAVNAQVVSAAKASAALWGAADGKLILASAEQRHTAELVKDMNRLRAYRDRLTNVLDAHQSQEWANEGGLDDLLGLAASAAQ